ncbi:MAG: RecX family transcriptional regulator [Sphingobacteriales bacterium]|nr:MAG: RecX family transcriptional regulator [Sphingobacteriales bacterium]
MEESTAKAYIDKNTARIKAESYCAYQERSHYEVKLKLYELGAYPADADNIICELIANNFLNEERFALNYTSGKFNIKNWGKIKIKQGLRLKKVSEPLIKKALNSINYDTYLDKLEFVLTKKRKDIKEKEPYKIKYKLQQYALSRGFENDLIFLILNNSDLNIL